MTTPAATEHRSAAILSIGDELTLGQKLDTNARWLSQQLVDLGISIIEHVTVPDDLDAHAAALARLAPRCDLIISSGGLGPTADDLTRQALAIAARDTLVHDADGERQIRAWFAARARSLAPINLTQARRPSRGSLLENKHGTAPGLFSTIESASHRCDVFCLPGPPREMMPMFDASVRPALRPPEGRVIHTRVLHSVGLGESDLAQRLGPLMDRSNVPLIGTTASGGIVSIRIRYEGEAPRERARALVDAAAEKVMQLAGDYVFADGHDSLASVVLRTLKERGQSIAVVESCTGGTLAEELTAIPGSSASMLGGWITYSNQMKQTQVGVPTELFAQGAPGAVSREVARAMARGGRDRSGASIALSITGIAGPDGGTPTKPVGTVWISLAHASGSDTRRFSMAGDRASIRAWSCTAALAMAWQHLAGRSHPLLRQLEAHAE
ncbi:MAG: competence/damage-inducible protein A [Phycisphaerae bacterium]|nr:competence/damage-inducible protein A [Phycisphaerae bacterium]